MFPRQELLDDEVFLEGRTNTLELLHGEVRLVCREVAVIGGGVGLNTLLKP